MTECSQYIQAEIYFQYVKEVNHLSEGTVKLIQYIITSVKNDDSESRFYCKRSIVIVNLVIYNYTKTHEDHKLFITEHLKYLRFTKILTFHYSLILIIHFGQITCLDFVYGKLDPIPWLNFGILFFLYKS